MSNKSVFEDQREHFVISWNRIHMGILGAWPNPEVTDSRLANFIAFLIGSNVIMLITIPQLLFVFKIWPDFELVPECLSIGTFPSTIGVLKLYALCSSRKALVPLIEAIIKDWSREKSDFELRTMRENANISKLITLYCSSFTMTAASLFLIQEGFISLRSSPETRRWLYLSHFPYCPTSRVPAYYFIMFFQLIAGVMAAIIYCGLVSFCGMLIMHLHGQFVILKNDIEDIINNHEFQNFDEFRSKMKFIVLQHEHLIRFAETIEETFNKAFLTEMIMFSVEICLQGYMFIHTFRKGLSLYEIVFWATFFFTILSNLYVICFIGEKMLNTNAVIQNSVHECDWYNLKASEAKDLIMILLRTNNQLTITAGKFCPFSFETFMSIIKRAFAFMSMLLTVKQ